MSSGKRLPGRARPLASQHTALDDRLVSAGVGCPNRPPCRHGDGLHKDGMCTALNCYCGHSFRAPPTAGSCWMQAYTETIALPSWSRSVECRRRFDELVAGTGVTR